MAHSIPGLDTWFSPSAHPYAGKEPLRAEPVLDKTRLPAALSLASARNLQIIEDTPNGPVQFVRVVVNNSGPVIAGSIGISGRDPLEVTFALGSTTINIPVPAVTTSTPITLVIEIPGYPTSTIEFVLEPVRPWTVYLLPQSHVDIGFTALQPSVERSHWEYLESSITAARDTEVLGPDAQFKWNTEGLWAIDGYLEQATPDQRNTLLDAIDRGWIGLDAMFANLLTGITSGEELIHSLDVARELRRDFGVTIDAAMVSDTPGATWGVVPALAQSGIRYLSLGPNPNWRVGNIYQTLADVPFYWVGPSGKDRVLCWLSSVGYSYFALQPLRTIDRVEEYLHTLNDAGFPYDITILRYSLFDNAAPDPNVSSFVSDWNQTHRVPRFVIARTTDAFRAFEDRYGDSLPEYSGDFTPYWEDGALSTARETATNLRSVARLDQAERLWAMLAPTEYARDEFEAAWRFAHLFDEHTWGAYASILDPDDPFVQAQWAIKQGYGAQADALSRELLERPLADREDLPTPITRAEVFNTSGVARSALVYAPADWALPGDRVLGSDGNPVASQRLSDGRLAFRAEDVQPLASSVFEFSAGTMPAAENPVIVGTHSLSNGRVSVELDPATGAIASFRDLATNREFVDRSGGWGLGEYLYVPGRDPAAFERSGPAAFQILDQGPLLGAIRAECTAPGTQGLLREYRLAADADYVEVMVRIDKTEVRTPEGVHIAFPFDIPDVQIRMGIPWAILRPDINQLGGSNKNFFPFNQWVDLANDGFGVTWVSLDAPIVEFGVLGADATVVGWRDTAVTSPRLFSFVMNNYWETNYRASQEGLTEFHYAIRPHEVFNHAEAMRFAESLSQPMIVARAESDTGLSSLVQNSSGPVTVANVKPISGKAGWSVRLFNASVSPATTTLRSEVVSDMSVYSTDFNGTRRRSVSGEITLAPYEVVTLDVESASSSGGPCFIATALMGTPAARELDSLRRFRDESLLTNFAGSAFTDAYYRIGAPAAGFISRHTIARQWTGAVLSEVMSIASDARRPTSLKYAGSIIFLAAIALGVLHRRRQGGLAGK